MSMLLLGAGSTSVGAAATLDTTGLVAWYAFNEFKAGTIRVDCGGNNRTLTDNGTVGVTDPGKVGDRAAGFNGSSHYLTSSDSAFDLTGECGFMFWFNPTAFAVRQDLISNWDGSDQHYGISFDQNAQLFSWIQEVSTQLNFTAGSLTNGQWHHIALTRRGSTGDWSIDLYVDGALAETLTTSSDPGTGGNFTDRS